MQRSPFEHNQFKHLFNFRELLIFNFKLVDICINYLKGTSCNFYNNFSHVSGITLLGVPAEVYTHGTEYLMTGAVNVIIVMITIYIFLPVFYELQLSSVYEVCIHRKSRNNLQPFLNDSI